MQGASSGRRWLWILRQATTRHTFLGAELLRRIRQCRWNDERWRNVDVQFPGDCRERIFLSFILNGVVATFQVYRVVSRIFLQILKPSEKKAKYQYGGMNTGQTGRPSTPQRNPAKKKWQPSTEPAQQQTRLSLMEAIMLGKSALCLSKLT